MGTPPTSISNPRRTALRLGLDDDDDDDDSLGGPLYDDVEEVVAAESIDR